MSSRLRERCLSLPPRHTRWWNLLRLDLAPGHGQPAPVRLLLASGLAIVGSLVADALLVRAGTWIFPSTAGYVHFQFVDYGKLTVIGVVIACVAWPIVTRVCAAPRWLFTRLALLVTIVLLLPDVFILRQGQPGRAVAVLMVMHLAIAVVTYAALTRLAPTRAVAPTEARRPGDRLIRD